MHRHTLFFGIGLAMATAASAAPDAATRESVRLISANDMAGRPVATQEGGQVGHVEFVSLTLAQGTLAGLIIDTSKVAFPNQPGASTQGASAAGELMIVPWTQATLGDDRARVFIRATREQLASAPRLGRGDLTQLTQPDVATYVVDYWTPGTDIAALEAEQIEQAEQPQQSEPQQAQQQAGANGSQPARTPQNTAMMLVGQEVVAAVTDPLLQLDEGLRGSTVNDRAGNSLGEIRRVMLDPDAGAVAFAIIERQDEQLPVPIQALTWTAPDATLLTADRSLLQPDAALTQNADSVQRDRLEALYGRFGVEPYW